MSDGYKKTFKRSKSLLEAPQLSKKVASEKGATVKEQFVKLSKPAAKKIIVPEILKEIWCK
jgi:hypothetical protein